ncbi:SOS response-associated peptidase [Bdellovibrio svalbardensis]|uniref:Abasic site processing protein n=1 Tax=Bdellovibrio svalbardensis TaxID=2972972 RepID=A0ABT6DIB9_9BACT|nr:SOS response-associated peptidase family protein [Bdellovibrio svalbardensis]MDG0816264.1 SOS response-associated peptidase [Bdellovibrio svalbardensis]
MCASFGAASEFNLLQKTYHVELPPIIALPQQIIFPHTEAPVIVRKEEKSQVQLMNYSLIPSWSKERKPKFATYNARIEEVLAKPSWKDPFKTRHCLVPIKEFYESAYKGRFAGHKISIFNAHQALLTAAGIYDEWYDQKTGEIVQSFAILTTEPTQEILDAGHDRSPIFLQETACKEWLDGKMSGERWIEFLKNQRWVGELGFSQLEKLKGYTGQLSLFGED